MRGSKIWGLGLRPDNKRRRGILGSGSGVKLGEEIQVAGGITAFPGGGLNIRGNIMKALQYIIQIEKFVAYFVFDLASYFLRS